MRSIRPVAEEVSTHTSEPDTSASLETALDLVCGMTVEIANARHHTSYDGREFYFLLSSL